MKAQYFHYDILEVYELSKLEEYRDHRRLRVFAEKGCTCVECGVEGTIVALGKDRGGNLHLDVYTADFYPLTVDHIQPKSKGGSDDITNLQPMCCLCNWNKGDGDRPAKLGRRKYKYEEDIPTPPNTLKLYSKEDYTNENIQIGDLAYIRTGFKRRKIKELGIVDKFCINPNTGREAIMLKDNSTSIHHTNAVYKKI
jgi:5-methylcytosine-specific restriction endonuclease McrA